MPDPIVTAALADPAGIYVFGSNMRGRHGAGTAKIAARDFGAEEGVGHGFTGMAYAIPTRDRTIYRTLPLYVIAPYVATFLDDARDRPDMRFYVVAIGCGNAGYTAAHIAPMFARHTDNVLLPPEFTQVLNRRSDISIDQQETTGDE